MIYKRYLMGNRGSLGVNCTGTSYDIASLPMA